MDREKTLRKLVEDLRGLYREELLSVVLFGSASRGDHAGKYSDLNVLVVLEDLDLAYLERASEVAVGWTRRGNPPMLFFTPALVDESRDVFAMEFLDVRDAHEVLFGKDFFGAIEVAPEHLRHQLESELKGKRIQLRERYLLAAGKKKELHHTLVASFSPVMTICRGVLRLFGERSPGVHEEVIDHVCRRFDLDRTPFETVAAFKRGESVGGLDEVRETFLGYYRALGRLATEVDRFETDGKQASGQGGGD